MDFDDEFEDFNDIEDAKAPNYAELLSNLKNAEVDLSVSSYYYLSDLPAEYAAELKKVWSTIGDRRREMIARSMADIAENNYQVDFSPIAADLLTDKSENVRLAALDMLWDTDKVWLVNPIVKLMRDDQSTAVRASAAGSLGHYLLMAQWGE
ncbi:MAG: hypothetical protein AAF902_26225, partial [Chloroflexota bacterium]